MASSDRSSPAFPAQVVFRQRNGLQIYARQSRRKRALLWLLLTVVMLAPLVVGFFLLFPDGGGAALARLRERILADPTRLLDWRLAEVALIALGVPLVFKLQRRACIVLTSDTISVSSGLPWLGARLGLDWSAPLSSVENAVVTCAAPFADPWLAVRLKLNVNSRRREIQPAIWFLPDEPARRRIGTRFLALRRPRLADEQIEALPLIAALRERGVAIAVPCEVSAERSDDDLSTYPAVTGFVIASIVCGLYFVVESMTLDEFYAIGPSYADWIVIGMTGAAAALLLFNRGEGRRAPAMVQIVVAPLFGLTLALSSYPGLLRVGQIFGGPLQPVAFIADGSGGLAPAEASTTMPPWQPTKAGEFWASLKAAERIELNLRKGVLGIWQYDLERVDAALDRFYSTRAKTAAGR